MSKKPASNKLLSEARILAATRAPYLRAGLMAMMPVERPGLGTCAMDAHGRLYFDPRFLEACDIKTRAFVILHEFVHWHQKHAERQLAVCHSDNEKLGIWRRTVECPTNEITQSAFGGWVPAEATTSEKLGLPRNLTAEEAFLRKWKEHLEEKERQEEKQRQEEARRQAEKEAQEEAERQRQQQQQDQDQEDSETADQANDESDPSDGEPEGGSDGADGENASDDAVDAQEANQDSTQDENQDENQDDGQDTSHDSHSSHECEDSEDGESDEPQDGSGKEEGEAPGEDGEGEATGENDGNPSDNDQEVGDGQENAEGEGAEEEGSEGPEAEGDCQEGDASGEGGQDAQGDPDGSGAGSGEPGGDRELPGDTGEGEDQGGQGGQGGDDGGGDDPWGGFDPRDGGSASDGIPRPWELGPPSADAPGLTESDQDLIEAQVAKAIEDYEGSHGRGSVPGHLAKQARDLLHPIVDPVKELRSCVKYAVESIAGFGDYSYSRPSNRQIPGGCIFPSCMRPIPRVTVIVDSSGSMGDQDTAMALEVIASVLKGLPDPRGIRVLTGDTCVQSAANVFRKEQVQVVGDGGTSMATLIRQACEERPAPKVIILVTDLETDWPSQPIEPKLLVCATRRQHGYWCSAPPEWAQVVYLKPEEC